MIHRLDDTTTERILHPYAFRDNGARDRVARFIEQYPPLSTVLLEAPGVLCRAFPEGRYALDVRQDPDINNEQLVLSIGVRRDPTASREGIKRLLAFQDAWGIDADRRTEGRITIILESL